MTVSTRAITQGWIFMVKSYNVKYNCCRRCNPLPDPAVRAEVGMRRSQALASPAKARGRCCRPPHGFPFPLGEAAKHYPRSPSLTPGCLCVAELMASTSTTPQPAEMGAH